MFGDEDVDISSVVKRGRGPGGWRGQDRAPGKNSERESMRARTKRLKVAQIRVRKRKSPALRKCGVNKGDARGGETFS